MAPVRAEKEDFWVCQAEEIRYWRNARDVQRAVYSRHGIENCGFHRLDEETVGILERIDSDLHVPHLEDGESVFYHEWY